VTLAAALGISVVSPAAAETTTRRDRVGDAPASVDLLRVTYQHDRDLSQQVRVRNLDHQANIYLFLGTRRMSPQSKYTARVWKDGGDVKRRLQVSTVEGPGEMVPCPDMRATWRPQASRVSVSVPRTCVELPRVVTMEGFSIRDRDLPSVERFDRVRRALVSRR